MHNTDVKNLHSAVQYPDQVQKYIDTETSHGALLGPVQQVDHAQYHCSPLMSRPKEGDKRRIILDLSYPKGKFLNDHVDRNRFDNSDFILRFPTIDNIVHSVKTTVGFPMIFKVDVARAFRNLRVDPADGLKFGFKWKSSYYLDPGIAFSWVHGSASFQICSDAIAYIMKQKGFQIYCYIDDYIAVIPKDKAHFAFETLCQVLHELRLPINAAKVAPTRCLTCLGIEINIDNNTLRIQEDKLAEILQEYVSMLRLLKPFQNENTSLFAENFCTFRNVFSFLDLEVKVK